MSSDHWLWESDEGRVEITGLGPRYINILMIGRAGNGAVPDIEEAMAKYTPVEGVAIFFDAYELNSFANEFRARATEHVFNHRKTIGKLAVLSSSALVTMAVSTANLALGGIVDAYRDLAKFRALQRSIAEEQGLDFSKLAS